MHKQTLKDIAKCL